MSGIANDLNTLTDGQLVTYMRQGNQKAFDIVINRHYRSCVNVASSEFATWLKSIVSNQCRMLIRSRQRARFVYVDIRPDRDNSVPIELPAQVDSPEQTLMNQESLDILRREIRCIPPLFRNVLQLYDIQELPVEAVAARLRITIPALKSRLVRARTELKERVMRRYGKTLRGSRSLLLQHVDQQRK